MCAAIAPEDIGSAYNGVADNAVSLRDRKKSRTFHLRIFNNWVKSYLIDMYTPAPNASIFDCACGRGGDLKKWALKRPNFMVFGDVSEKSIGYLYKKLAGERLLKDIEHIFLIGDIFNCDLDSLVSSRDPHSFDLSSCQFAFHYAFSDQATATNAVHNLCSNLKPGGHVIITCPNACRIVQELKEKPFFDNGICRIERHFDPKNIPAFGAAYNFSLIESVDDCVEYLVHPAVINALFEAEGCVKIESCGFHEFYQRNYDIEGKYLDLYGQLMTGDDPQKRASVAAMTPEEWDVIGFYSFYVFQKVGRLQPTPIKQMNRRTPLSQSQFPYIMASTGKTETFFLSTLES